VATGRHRSDEFNLGGESVPVKTWKSEVPDFDGDADLDVEWNCTRSRRRNRV